MAQKDTTKHNDSVGNTKTESNCKKDTRARRWVFTLNNYTKKDIDTLNTAFQAWKCSYVYQEEIGEAETPHLQGCFSFRNAKKFSTIKKVLSDRIHLEKCKSWKQSIAYCHKEDTKNGEIYHSKDIIIPIPIEDRLKDLKLRPFQKEILSLISKVPDDRKIYWYWEPKGNIGKTSLAFHICLKYKALYLSGKGNDCKYGIVQYIEKNKNMCDIVIFDYVRSQEEYISYQAIEEIKNGIFFSGKYESGMVMYNPIHMIIFANFEPDETKLSKDRWCIKRIED